MGSRLLLYGDTMQRETFPVGPLQCNCSILYDTDANDATVVDPGGDLARILGFLASRQLKLRQIVVTHAHLDHIAGAKLLSEQTGAPVLFHQADLALLALMEQQAEFIGVPTPRVAPPDASAEDGMKLTVGAETGEVIFTPGHTPGSIALHFPASKLLIAGDTLFRGGIGAPICGLETAISSSNPSIPACSRSRKIHTSSQGMVHPPPSALKPRACSGPLSSRLPAALHPRDTA